MLWACTPAQQPSPGDNKEDPQGQNPGGNGDNNPGGDNPGDNPGGGDQNGDDTPGKEEPNFADEPWYNVNYWERTDREKVARSQLHHL